MVKISGTVCFLVDGAYYDLKDISPEDAPNGNSEDYAYAYLKQFFAGQIVKPTPTWVRMLVTFSNRDRYELITCLAHKGPKDDPFSCQFLLTTPPPGYRKVSVKHPGPTIKDFEYFHFFKKEV